MPGEMFSCEGFDCGACLGSTSLGASEQNVRRRAPPMCDEERHSPTGSRWEDTLPWFMECWPTATPCQTLEEDHFLLAL